MGSGVLRLVISAFLLAGCPPEVIDPSPPLAGQGGETESDNQLLEHDAQTCSQRRHAAEAHVLEALADAVEGCTSDADCVLFDPETGCYDSCPLAIAAHAEARVREAAADADRRWCAGFATDCPDETGPAADCANEPPRCDDGRCTHGPS